VREEWGQVSSALLGTEITEISSIVVAGAKIPAYNAPPKIPPMSGATLTENHQ
jgi:hypothetical protein